MDAPTDPRDYVRARLESLNPRFSWPCDPDAFRAALSEVFGGLSAWEKPAPDVQLGPLESLDGFTRQMFTFLTRPNLRAFGYWLTPKNPTGRGVLCLPGHGLGADVVAGVQSDDYQFQFGVQCAEQGHVALVLEQLSFGHRRDEAARAASWPGASSCSRDAMAATMLGESLMGWRIHDACRALDLLERHPSVDPEMLATLGISGGGLTSLFCAALDTRVETCLVSGYFNTWSDSILGVEHCLDNVAHGLAALCDMPELAGLIAPRRLFCESGDTDPIFPFPGFEKARARAEEIYASLGYPERFATEVFPGGHRFHGTRALDFLQPGP
jgi:hypothetical protein